MVVDDGIQNPQHPLPELLSFEQYPFIERIAPDRGKAIEEFISVEGRGFLERKGSRHPRGDHYRLSWRHCFEGDDLWSR